MRLDFDNPVAPADFQWAAGFERRLPANRAGNDEAAGRIHGCDHGMNHTMTEPNATEPNAANAPPLGLCYAPARDEPGSSASCVGILLGAWHYHEFRGKRWNGLGLPEA